MKSERIIFETIWTAASIATYPVRKAVGVWADANRKALEKIIAERTYPFWGRLSHPRR